MKSIYLFCLAWALPVAALAQFRFGSTITINEPVYEDLYITGGTININAPIHGDLVVAGGTININDSVTSDILVAGGNITFNGYVGDDIRCAGGNLYIQKDVAGDVVATGGTVLIGKGVSIGSFYSGGGEITIDGTVTGKLTTVSGNLIFNGLAKQQLDCRGGKLTINGTAEGDVVLSATNEIIIGNQAQFLGHVRYWVPGKVVDFKQSLKAGAATYDPSVKVKRDRWYFLGYSSVIGLLWYAGMALVLIMIVQYLFGASMKKAGETAYNAALKSLGYGLVFWLGVPVTAALAFITVIGVPIGLILLFGYVILLVLATVITSVVAANWLNSRSLANWHYWEMVFSAFGIFIVFKILTLTPFLGWFIFAILVCVSFGAILLNINWKKRPVTA